MHGDAADPELGKEASGAFQVLVDALVAQQQSGLVRRDDPLQLAQFIWSLVHGIAMLAIDGRLKPQNADVEEVDALRCRSRAHRHCGGDGHLVGLMKSTIDSRQSTVDSVDCRL